MLQIQSYAKMALEFNNIFTPNIQARGEEKKAAHHIVMEQVKEALEKMMTDCINNQNTRCLQRVQFLAMAVAFYASMLEDNLFSRQFSQMAGQGLDKDHFDEILTNLRKNRSIRRSLGDGQLYNGQMSLGQQSLANVGASLRKAMQICNCDSMSKMSRTPVVLLLVLHEDAPQHLKSIAKVLLQSLAYDILLRNGH